MNNKPFNHKISSPIECDPKDFPQQAFSGLFSFTDLDQCMHLLWKMLRHSVASDSRMEEEERQELFNFYEVIHDVLNAVYMVHKENKLY